MGDRAPDGEGGSIQLRDVRDTDLPVLFEQQLDPEANRMAAFTVADPTDRDAFAARWSKILSDETITTRAIVFGGQVAGSILSYHEDDRLEVSYWIGSEYWGKGVATAALAAFLDLLKVRPLYARAARDNVASIRVLEKCGFTICGEDRGFANARGEEIEEYILKLG